MATTNKSITFMAATVIVNKYIWYLINEDKIENEETNIWTFFQLKHKAKFSKMTEEEQKESKENLEDAYEMSKY